MLSRRMTVQVWHLRAVKWIIQQIVNFHKGNKRLSSNDLISSPRISTIVPNGWGCVMCWRTSRVSIRRDPTQTSRKATLNPMYPAFYTPLVSNLWFKNWMCGWHLHVPRKTAMQPSATCLSASPSASDARWVFHRVQQILSIFSA